MQELHKGTWRHALRMSQGEDEARVQGDRNAGAAHVISQFLLVIMIIAPTPASLAFPQQHWSR